MHRLQKLLVGLSLGMLALVASALPGFAGQLDDYYLSAFAAKPSGTPLEKALLTTTPAPGSAVRSGTPLKHGLARDWSQLQPATQTVLAKQLALPVISGTSATLLSSGGHFRIHYATSGVDLPSIADINSFTGLALGSSGDWAAQVALAFEAAYAFYQGLGYHMPPVNPYDVYLKDLTGVGEYGETDNLSMVPSSGFPNASSSYIIIDKDFTNTIFHPAVFNPLQSLDVTSVHEYHHAVQYGYNFYFDIWFAEATSTWYEGELYPGVDQNYDYIAGWFGNSTRQMDLPGNDPLFSSQAYGRWIFNRYLAERHSGDMIRACWTLLAGLSPPGNGVDIPMLPVVDSVLTSYGSSLAADFLGFAKRVYTRDWPTTATVTTRQIGLIPEYHPSTIYTSYPVTATTTSLSHSSFAYYRFVPSASMATLTISLSKTSGMQAVIFKKAGGAVTEVALDPNGSTYTINNFNLLTGASDEVVLLLANPTQVDGHQASFSTNGSTSSVQEPTPTAASGSSSKSGCFIATAAYGSYLHPKVALLRAFRDRYLLTNPPGRLFVALYYRVSPPIADLIARHELLRGAARVALAPLLLGVEHPRAALALICLALLLAVRGVRARVAARRADPVA